MRHMSLVTRCPTCATAFKVVRDQLRISDGWVRCGRCSQVFDATMDLKETDEEGAVQAPATVPQTPHSPALGSTGATLPIEEPLPSLSTGMALPRMSWPAADMLELGPRPSPLPTAMAQVAPVVEPAAKSADADEEPWWSGEPLISEWTALEVPSDPARVDPHLDAPPVPQTPSPIDDAVNAQLQKALRRERVKALRKERAEQRERQRAGEELDASGLQLAHASAEAEANAVPALETPAAAATFASEAEPVTPKGGRRQRVVLVLLCVLAALILVLQFARQERDVLAASQPSLRPALQALCNATGCELSALRQIASITIEGASFSREKEGDAYRLMFTLRNGARMPLAMPAVELTLLDTEERAVVRRVLTPTQFGAPAVLGASAERTASLSIELAGSDAAALPPVSGYRVIAFYP